MIELDEEPEADADGWAQALLERLAFAHIAAGRCIGYTIESHGRVSCGACGWRVAARPDETPAARARFGMLVLAAIGEHFTPALLEVIR